MSDPLNGPRKKPEYPIALATILGVHRDLVPTQFWWKIMMVFQKANLNKLGCPLNIRTDPYFFTIINDSWDSCHGFFSWGFECRLLPIDPGPISLVKTKPSARQAFPTLIAWGLPGVPSLGSRLSKRPVQNVVPFASHVFFFGVLERSRVFYKNN